MKIKNVLISQPPPADLEKSPYRDLIEKYNLKIDFLKLFRVEGISGREFRLDKVRLHEFDSVIFTSRHAVDHYFRIAKEIRYEIPDTLKYFCISEAIALYLQKYVQYRKRKIFHGKQTPSELMDMILKFPDDRFVLPCSDGQKQEMPELLEKNNINFKRAVMFRNVDVDLKSEIEINKYDMIVFFSPSGVKSLMNNFPDFVQGNKIIAAFGANTATAIQEYNLTLNVHAPTKTSPSMTMAIEEFLKNQAKKK